MNGTIDAILEYLDSSVGPKNAADVFLEISPKTKDKMRAVTIALDFLASFDIIIKRGDKYWIHPFTHDFLRELKQAGESDETT